MVEEGESLPTADEIGSQVEEFLREKIAPMDGGVRASEQALEKFRLCLAARKNLSLPDPL